MSNLKHVNKLQSLEIYSKEKQSNGRWLSSLKHAPTLARFSVCGGGFVGLPLDSFVQLKNLTELSLMCQFPTDADFRPLQKLNLREVTLGGRETTDSHIPAILPLAKLRKLKSIRFLDSRFSEAGLAELRGAFKQKLLKW